MNFLELSMYSSHDNVILGIINLFSLLTILRNLLVNFIFTIIYVTLKTLLSGGPTLDSWWFVRGVYLGQHYSSQGCILRTVGNPKVGDPTPVLHNQIEWSLSRVRALDSGFPIIGKLIVLDSHPEQVNIQPGGPWIGGLTQKKKKKTLRSIRGYHNR